MSPHAVPTSPIIDSDYDNVNLYKDFDVSSQGFLPAAAPLELLPDERYASWEFLAHNIPQLLREGTLRIEVDSLDVLNTDSLLSEAEWRGAYVILTFLAQAYIWGGIKPAEVWIALSAICVDTNYIAGHPSADQYPTPFGCEETRFAPRTDIRRKQLMEL